MAKELTRKFGIPARRSSRRKTLAELGIRQVFDEAAAFDGDLTIGSSTLFKGFLNGSVKCQKDVDSLLLITSPGSTIRGHVDVPRLLLYGTFDGEIDAALVRVAKGAQCTGVIRCERITIDPDADISNLQLINAPYRQGNLEHDSVRIIKSEGGG